MIDWWFIVLTFVLGLQIGARIERWLQPTGNRNEVKHG